MVLTVRALKHAKSLVAFKFRAVHPIALSIWEGKSVEIVWVELVKSSFMLVNCVF